VQQPSVGLKADLPQHGQINQPFANVEVARVIDRGFRAQRPTFFMILVDARMFVINMKRRCHAFCNNARPKPTGRARCDTPVEDQLHLVWAAQVQILANRSFEEQAPGQGAIQDLRQSE